MRDYATNASVKSENAFNRQGKEDEEEEVQEVDRERSCTTSGGRSDVAKTITVELLPLSAQAGRPI